MWRPKLAFKCRFSFGYFSLTPDVLSGFSQSIEKAGFDSVSSAQEVTFAKSGAKMRAEDQIGTKLPTST